MYYSRQPATVVWTAYQHRVFGDSIDDQERLIYALREYAEHHPDNRLPDRIANKLQNCVAHPIICSDPAETDCVICEDRCKSRSCLRCSRIRSIQLMAKGLKALENCNDPRFLTVTLKSRNESLRRQLKQLTRCFAKLRRSAIWKAHVTGGLYVIEVTYNHQTDLFHPHLHAVVDGHYFPQPLLKGAWKVATGDSEIVHIARTGKREALARYLSKYVAKGSDAKEWPRLRLAEFATAIHGLRLVQTFGSLHAIKLSRDTDDAWPFTERVVHLSELKRRASLPEADVRSLIDRLLIRTARFHKRQLAAEPQAVNPEYTELLKAIKSAITPRKTPVPPARHVQTTLRWTCLHAPPIYEGVRV